LFRLVDGEEVRHKLSCKRNTTNRVLRFFRKLACQHHGMAAMPGFLFRRHQTIPGSGLASSAILITARAIVCRSAQCQPSRPMQALSGHSSPSSSAC
jgi:hypothetical protein